MNTSLCFFPFIQIKEEFNILGIKLKPFTVNQISTWKKDEQQLGNTVIKTILELGGKINACTYAYISTTRWDAVIRDLKRIADFLRYRISFEDEDIDYDQALFILAKQEEGSTKVSINGGRITILESDTMPHMLMNVTGRTLLFKKEDIPNIIPFTGLLARTFQDYGLRSPDEERFWRALDWYSKSFIKDYGLDERYEIICLTAAFESLLDLPSENIGSSFRSYVSNFLGSSEDLNHWAREFYNLRSKIVHGEQIIFDRRIGEVKKGEAAIYHRLIRTSSDFVKSIDIARPVFRDFVECLSIIQKKEKQYDYEDVFNNIDEKILVELKKTLKTVLNGIQDEDDFNSLFYYIDKLHGDQTAKATDLHEISQALIQTLKETFESTVCGKIFKEKNDEIGSIEKQENDKLWLFCNECAQTIRDILAAEGDLPYKDGPGTLSNSPSNLFVDILKIALDWFSFAADELYKLKCEK